MIDLRGRLSVRAAIFNPMSILERIESLATVSVARGCGFAMIAIGTTMVGLVYDPVQCLQIGGILSLLTTLVLILKAFNADRKPYRDTEVWLMLAPEERPPTTIAQGLVSRALKSSYLHFAYYFANGACTLIVVSIVVASWRG